MPDDVVSPPPPQKARNASFIGCEGLPPDEHRAIGARGKLSLEERQRQALARNTAPPPKDPVAAALIGSSRRVTPADFKQVAKEQIRAQIREFLDAEVTVGRGKNAKRGKRLQFIAENLFRTAIDRRSPFAVPAANALLDRGFGKPVAGDLDDPASKRGGLTVVYVDRAPLLPDVPVINAEEIKQLTPAPPEFIDEDKPND